MALTPLKVLLFLGGGTIAAGGTAYFAGALDPYLNSRAPSAETAAPETQKMAALPPAATGSDQANPPSTAAPAAPAAEAPAAPAYTPKPPEGDAGAQATVQAPAFDIVRVEPDGSIVIAGRSAPNAKVEAVIGSKVIGSATASADGDFAIILDEPLKPGDYQIVLRSTTPDNVVAMSLETAVVSVPETPDGQVLALVEEPGKPSELITVPKPAQLKPGETAAASPSASGEKAPEQGEQNVASATQEPPKANSAAEQPAGGPAVAVEAVEIEGRKIFVAGSSEAGQLVRAYANEILLGETTTSSAGRFLVEAERDLPVGDYIIRVDALAPDGAKVVARAAVPFEREAGENLAAVAPPSGNTGGGTDGAPAANTETAPQPAADATNGATPAQSGDSASPEQPADVAAQPSGDQQPNAGASSDTATASSQETGAAATEPSQQPAATATAPAEQPAQSTTDQPATGVASASSAEKPASTTETSSSEGTSSASAAAAEATAPKLQKVDGSVIIRRGDSLWRISKRVYGRGVRYSHIYLANQEQIRDPDLIMPGQVFTVPSKTKEGEAADMTKLGEQAVAPGASETKQE